MVILGLMTIIRGEYGWAGTDDLIVSPNDPGYVAALASPPVTPSEPVATGEYVDINWGSKVLAHLPSPVVTQSIVSQLSGVTSSGFPSASVYKSGQALYDGTIWRIRQPTYDTWTTQFEGDGMLQGTLAGWSGVIRIDTSGSVPPGYVIDAGTDGIDNNAASGVDDLSEQETSAPFPVPLRGIKISVRLEDPAARHFNQMSVSKEFVTQ